MWRGWRVRRSLSQRWLSSVSASARAAASAPSAHSFFLRRLGRGAARLEAAAAGCDSELDSLFADLDQQRLQCREGVERVQAECSALLDSSSHAQDEGGWAAVRRMAERRSGLCTAGGRRAGGGVAEVCCICCEPLLGAQLVLLSCSHVLHRTCSEAYERFTGGVGVVREDDGDAEPPAEGQSRAAGESSEGAALVPLYVPASCLCPLCRTAYSKIRL